MSAGGHVVGPPRLGDGSDRPGSGRRRHAHNEAALDDAVLQLALQDTLRLVAWPQSKSSSRKGNASPTSPGRRHRAATGAGAGAGAAPDPMEADVDANMPRRDCALITQQWAATRLQIELHAHHKHVEVFVHVALDGFRPFPCAYNRRASHAKMDSADAAARKVRYRKCAQRIQRASHAYLRKVARQKVLGTYRSPQYRARLKMKHATTDVTPVTQRRQAAGGRHRRDTPSAAAHAPAAAAAAVSASATTGPGQGQGHGHGHVNGHGHRRKVVLHKKDMLDAHGNVAIRTEISIFDVVRALPPGPQLFFFTVRHKKTRHHHHHSHHHGTTGSTTKKKKKALAGTTSTVAFGSTKRMLVEKDNADDGSGATGPPVRSVSSEHARCLARVPIRGNMPVATEMSAVGTAGSGSGSGSRLARSVFGATSASRRRFAKERSGKMRRSMFGSLPTSGASHRRMSLSVANFNAVHPHAKEAEDAEETQRAKWYRPQEQFNYVNVHPGQNDAAAAGGGGGGSSGRGGASAKTEYGSITIAAVLAATQRLRCRGIALRDGLGGYGLSSGALLRPDVELEGTKADRRNKFNKSKAQEAADTDAWTLGESVFAPRAKECDSGTYWDTPRCWSRLYRADFRYANIERLRLVREATSRPASGLQGVVKRIFKELAPEWRHVVEIFNVAAAVGVTRDKGDGKLLCQLSAEGFCHFLDSCGLVDSDNAAVSRGMHMEDVEVLFVTVNIEGSNTGPRGKATDPDDANDAHAVTRFELLQALVRIAFKWAIADATSNDTNLHAPGGADRVVRCVEDVVRAVRRCGHLMGSLLGRVKAEDGAASSATLDMDPNKWRSSHLYTKEVGMCYAAKGRLRTLKRLYAFLCAHHMVAGPKTSNGQQVMGSDVHGVKAGYLPYERLWVFLSQSPKLLHGDQLFRAASLKREKSRAQLSLAKARSGRNLVGSASPSNTKKGKKKKTRGGAAATPQERLAHLSAAFEEGGMAGKQGGLTPENVRLQCCRALMRSFDFNRCHCAWRRFTFVDFLEVIARIADERYTASEALPKLDEAKKKRKMRRGNKNGESDSDDDSPSSSSSSSSSEDSDEMGARTDSDGLVLSRKITKLLDEIIFPFFRVERDKADTVSKKIQAHVRGRQARQKRQRQEDCAMMIQRTIRKKLAAAAVAKEKAKEERRQMLLRGGGG